RLCRPAGAAGRGAGPGRADAGGHRRGLLYARIDMARDADGGWLLMEAELIEPDFYLGSAPEGGKRFAEAVRARL
ncbi:MAG: hypothetical protein M3Q74_03355, partial [Pseudomonadota bacterium]|nr:hypothetical protein [Pseudomonadota bacterium]